MPISGKFYSSNELQKILSVSKGRIGHIASANDWLVLVPGSALYCAEQVEDYLLLRGIDPDELPIRDYDYSDGATRQKREQDYFDASQIYL